MSESPIPDYNKFTEGTDDLKIDILRGSSGVTDQRIIDLIRKTIQNQQIPLIGPLPSTSSSFAGGTNLVPNSDLAFSYLAATVPGTLPGTAGATNLECYRITRQKTTDPISAQRLRTVEANAWIPIWDRVRGVGELGGAAGNDNYDLAFQFTNNWLVGSRRWFIRVAIATADDTPLPTDIKLFAGFWISKGGGATQEWVQGGNFNLASKIFGIPGARNFDYYVVAKLDNGYSLSSQTLNRADIPAVLDENNYVQITYPGAAGYTEFEVYRRDNGTGVITQIARDRNTSKLVAYDTGQEGKTYPAFPTVDTTKFRAYSTMPIDAVSIDKGKTFHDMQIVIPTNFDTSTIDPESTFLRIGVTGPTATNLQVLVDQIWAAETYNVWSPSPLDNYGSPPSTAMTSGTPTSGGGTGDPPVSGGGKSCVWSGHDLKLTDGWVVLKKARPTHKLHNGLGGLNRIEKFKEGVESQGYEFEFDCGLVIWASFSHRFARTLNDPSGVSVDYLQPGMKLQGGHNGSPRSLTIVSKKIVNRDFDFRSVNVSPSSESKLYAVGDRKTGWYVYCHNEKFFEFQ